MKKACLLIIFIAFFLPLIQMNIPYAEEDALKGSYEFQNAPTSLDVGDWIKGTYQKQYKAYFNDSIGFKSTLVRLYNQVSFYAFEKANSESTIMGKNKILFQEDDVRSFMGEDFLGKQELDTLTEKFKNAQELLAEEGVMLVAVIAPSKASFYSSHLPDKYPIAYKKLDNYSYLTEAFKKEKLNHIDLSAFLRNYQSDYPLYPKNGTHWSGYSTALTFDTICKYLSQNLGKRLKGFKVNPGVFKSDSLEYTDNDIADAMNLLLPPDNFRMYYPKIVFEKGNYYRPNALVIGDSYAQSFYGFYPFYENIFSENTSLWYYNRIVMWSQKEIKDANVPNLDLRQELVSRDVILLLANEANLDQLGFGFLDECPYILKSQISPREREIAKIEKAIKANPSKLKRVTEQAIERNDKLEYRIRANAIYIYNLKRKLQ